MSVKRRGISAIVTLMLIFSLVAITQTDTMAAEEAKVKSTEELPIIDGSYLIKDEESVGTTIPMTRGEDLMTGYSKVRRYNDCRTHRRTHRSSCNRRTC